MKIVEPIGADLLTTYPLFVAFVSYENNTNYLDDFGKYFVPFNLALISIRAAMTVVEDLLANRYSANSTNLKE